jgi:uncharacterized phage protein gp47/JayE
MNLAAMQRLGPLLALGNRKSGDLNDNELSGIASAIAGQAAPELLPLLQMLRKAEPTTAVTDILGSDTAKKLFERMKAETAESQSCIFIKCPHCERLFETELA